MAVKKPTAVEAIPGVDEILGVDETANLYVNMLVSAAQTERNRQLLMLAEGLKETDVVPQGNGDSRTFKEMSAAIKKGIADLWKEAEREGLRANVEQKLRDRRNGSG